MKKFNIGDKVIALTNPQTKGSQPRVKGNIYIVKDIMYCPKCGRQLINITTTPTIYKNLFCSCGNNIPHYGKKWTDSKYFTKVNENSLQEAVEEENYEFKKKDVIIPHLPAPIKVGDRVVFIDGSYTLSLVENSLEHTYLGLSDDIFTVVAINVPLPSDTTGLDILQQLNNCIVRNKDGYHFCSHLNIRALREIGDTLPFRIKE